MENVLRYGATELRIHKIFSVWSDTDLTSVFLLMLTHIETFPEI